MSVSLSQETPITPNGQPDLGGRSFRRPDVARPHGLASPTQIDLKGLLWGKRGECLMYHLIYLNALCHSHKFQTFLESIYILWPYYLLDNGYYNSILFWIKTHIHLIV